MFNLKFHLASSIAKNLTSLLLSLTLVLMTGIAAHAQ